MPPTRTFIIPGNLPHLSRIRNYLNPGVCGILIHEKITVSEARAAGACAEEFSDRIYTLQSLSAPTTPEFADKDLTIYERCLRSVLADPRVHYLAMRSYFNSAFNSTIVIERTLVNSILIIKKTRPTRLLSTSTPHSVEAWVFAKCLEEMGIPVYILERTAINNRAWIYRGMDTQDVMPRPVQSTAAPVTDYSQRQVREQRESKAGERDQNGFYVSRMDLSSVKGADSNKWWSYRRELPLLLAGRPISLPIRLGSIYLKHRLYRSYRRVAVNELPDTPFVIYFMHYQPERSSLPEGLFHVQQWFAIRSLAWTLPPGWSLLVREHPTMWLQPLDITVRTPDFFEEVAALPNTKVCSMDVDTFELIDRCNAVATLTGSVGFQAILRNKPVLAFGLPAYKDHPACLSVRSSEDLVKAFRDIQEGALSSRFDDETLEKYLLWVEQNSIAVDPNETDWLEARLKNFTELYRELLCGDIEL